MIACVDCYFHDDDYGNNCSHPAILKDDPVHGKVLTTCRTARATDGKCGPEAKMFNRRIRFWEGL